MIEIDGSQGEGGGQILRTSLSLSMLRGEPLHMTNIRAGRSKPGLMRQHLAAVKAAGEMCQAKTEGMELGSTDLLFEPQSSFSGGEVHVELSTAGSTGLIFQTLLPSMLSVSKPTRLVLKGGTHNPMAPCFDFLKDSFLPCLHKMGYDVEIDLLRRGFYPAGGGEFQVQVHPTKKRDPYVEKDRKALRDQVAICLIANLYPAVIEKEVFLLGQELGEDMPIKRLEDKTCRGPGNVILIKKWYGDHCSLFSSFGERGRSSQQVVDDVVHQMDSFDQTQAVHEPRLADQLLLPMLLTKGGSFTTSRMTNHLRAQADLLNRVCGDRVELKEEDGLVRVSVKEV